MEHEAGTPKKFSISCTDVPQELLDSNNAKTYFRQFGRIIKICLRTKSRSCIIDYETQEGAESALKEAGTYNGLHFNVALIRNSKMDIVTPVKQKQTLEKDPEWVPDPEVLAELEAYNDDIIPKDYNLRSTDSSPKSPEEKREHKLKKLLTRGLDAATALQKLAKREQRKSLKAGGADKSPSAAILKARERKLRTWRADTLKIDGKKPLKSPDKSPRRPKPWTQDQLDLLKLLKQAALTTEDKYKALEARDKLLRLRTKRHTDLSKAKKTIGTCPDMCPEKERLMRVVQHQVSGYEQDSVTKQMIPELAVKQYSRSSADQETPLPHELRPVPVLEMTMGYMMYEIMNQCDDPNANLAEWYHFMWDRTRGIRKDITQQELCCQGSVALVEQCARFHIHCSARLAGEDPSVFDQKINTENLTKCLQTLKYMYNDLRLKGESCPNEAEFRAYVILLNLNDGNFMWEVQQLRPEIQKSPHIQYALQVYSALDKNNYVKFFKLVHSTTYLKACILLRYFIQVRIKALTTIIKCYSPRLSYTQYPLEELQQILAFEDIESTIDFLEYYNLYLNQERTHVVLDKKSFNLPELPYPLDRAINVIEQKRTTSVGEIVCGSLLPAKTYTNHKTSSSFDSDGMLDFKKYFPDADDKIITKSAFTFPSDSGNEHLKSMEKVFKQPIKSILKQSSTITSPSFSIQQEATASKSTSIFSKDITDKPSDAIKSFWSTQKDIEPKNLPSTNIFGNQQAQQQSASSIFGRPFAQPSTTPSFSAAVKPIGGFKFDLQSSPSNLPGSSNTNKGFTSSSSNIFTTDQQVKNNTFGGFKSSGDGGLFGNNASVTTGIASKIFPSPATTTTAASSTSLPGFTFNLPSRNEDEERQKALEEIKQKIEEEKKKELERNKQLRLQKQLELEKRKQEEERRKREEMELRKKQEEERLARIKFEEEQQRKTQEEKKRLLELERLRILEEKRKEEERLKELQRKKEQEKRRIKEIRDTVKSVLEDLLSEVEEIYKRDRLKCLAANIKRRKMVYYINRWLETVAIRKRKRQALEIPHWISSLRPEEEAKELFTLSQGDVLENLQRYKTGESGEVRMSLEKIIPKLDLCELIYPLLLNRISELKLGALKDFFWKIVISLPDEVEMKNSHKIDDVLSCMLNFDRDGMYLQHFKTIFGYRLSCCIQKFSGSFWPTNDINGILIVGKDMNRFFLSRLQEALRHCNDFNKVPLYVIMDDENVEEGIFVELMEKNLISDYNVILTDFTPENISSTVDEGLKYIISNYQKPPPLEMQLLKVFLLENLGPEFWLHVQNFSYNNEPYRQCLTSPRIVVSLYNEAVDRLKGMIFKEEYKKYPKFGKEFKKFLPSQIPEVFPCDYKYFFNVWSENCYSRRVFKFFELLKLPNFKAVWPPANQKELEEIMYNYCTICFVNPESRFLKVMGTILNNFDIENDFDQIKHLTWTSIIEVFAAEKIEELDYSLNATEFKNSLIDEYIVIYDLHALKEYREDLWFYLKHPLIKEALDFDQENVLKKEHSSLGKRRFVEELEDYDFDVDAMLKGLLEDKDLDSVSAKRKKQMDGVRKMIEDLENSMATSKKINHKINEKLTIFLKKS